MYFMYVDMAWFQSLLRLEHEKNAFLAFPSRNAILITEISDFY